MADEKSHTRVSRRLFATSRSEMEISMRKRTLSNEYVSSFCLEMSLLMHAGIGTEDGLYLLVEDETNTKNKKMPMQGVIVLPSAIIMFIYIDNIFR